MLAMCVAGTACATSSTMTGPPISRKRVTDTLAMIKRAEEHDGARDERATELRAFSWKEYDDAKKAAADGDNTRASTGLARAEIDAELAVALSDKFIAVAQAADLEARVKAAKVGPPPGKAPGK